MTNPKTTKAGERTQTAGIVERLLEHLSGDGLYNDSDTDDLYREYFGISDDSVTDGDEVAKWAVETAQGAAIAKAKAGEFSEKDRRNAEDNRAENMAHD